MNKLKYIFKKNDNQHFWVMLHLFYIWFDILIFKNVEKSVYTQFKVKLKNK